MARAGTTFLKRAKEMAKRDKQKQKEQRRAQRKTEREDGLPGGGDIVVERPMPEDLDLE